MNGIGTKIWENGDKYQGEWYMDHMHGQGTYTALVGDIYNGEWNLNKKEGNGIMYWKSS